MIESHPVAALFPMLDDDDLKALADDIAENGLLHPILRDEQGRIVDGRNRQRACELAGVEPTYVSVPDETAAALILSANLQRRHLDAGQRAMLGAQARLLLSNSQTEVAASVGVSQAYIAQAAVVIEELPGEAADVADGHTSLSAAYQSALQRREERKAHAARVSDSLRDVLRWAHVVAGTPALRAQTADVYADELGQTAPIDVTPASIAAAADNLTALAELWEQQT